jgi:hypothetical protein
LSIGRRTAPQWQDASIKTSSFAAQTIRTLARVTF